MTKATLLGITSLVWTAGFAATGAFVLTFTQSQPKPHVAVASMPESRMPHALPERTIVLPAVDIVSEMPHRTPPVTRAVLVAPKGEEPHVVRCSDWRPLEQGSASVQICE